MTNRVRPWALPAVCLIAGCVSIGFLFVDKKEREAKKKKASNSKPNALGNKAGKALFDAVGNTPLIDIKSLSKLTNCKIYGKAEYMNPTFSLKDRAAKQMILEAEEKGLLDPNNPKNCPVIEATGGNTGASLAMLCASRGYPMTFVMPEKVSKEKIRAMQISGAKVHVVPNASFFDKEKHFFHVAESIKDTYNLEHSNKMTFLNQFDNQANMRAHYQNTAPEIWEQTNGKIDGFVSVCGTGGMISGCSNFFKEKSDQIKVWLIDPVEIDGLSAYVNGASEAVERDGRGVVPTKGGSTIAEGIGVPLLSPNFKLARVDKGITGSNQEIVTMAYHLLHNDGIFIGPSAALNVVGAYKMAKELGPGHTIVTTLCDSGERYMGKLYNATWLENQGISIQNIEDIETPVLGKIASI
uniref:Cysteine synthase putative n=1 Tax=Albugo laibachii Nc14 TaxID=890382 RepID=F0W6S6_9STRA|nr:cysteine synthase putative [Albugo laibachii Nc14]|eukprot:CCA16821.1 cysteine synthase putative [Albugo laibachii Nc14]